VKKPVLLVVNKVDTVPKPLLLPFVTALTQVRPFDEVLFVSALTGDGLDRLLSTTLARLPEGPPLFDAETFTDQQEVGLAAELIREQVLRHTRQEVPHSSAVVIDAFDESERAPRPGSKPGGLQGLVRIHATLFVERESQKAIVIGKRGAMLKTIGTDARKSLERLLGTHVYLDLRVKVEPRWTESGRGLRKVGLS
jgi:GTP-binding protein Era